MVFFNIFIEGVLLIRVENIVRLKVLEGVKNKSLFFVTTLCLID